MSVIELEWQITRKPIADPPTEDFTLEYTGESIAPDWGFFDPSTCVMSGITSAIARGEYQTTFTPKDNYCWSNGGTESRTVSWKIVGMIGLPFPSPLPVTYNGSLQFSQWDDYDPDKVDVAVNGYSATNAGTYTAVFTPKEGYTWNDGTTEPKSIPWTMLKADGSLSISKTSIALSPTVTSATFTVTRAGTGTITATSSNTNVVTTSVSGTTVTLTRVNPGSAVITVQVGADTNYLATGKEFCVVTSSAETEIPLPVPSTLTYTGSAQSPTWSNYNSTQVTMSCTAQTNAGTYSATFTPKTGYAWQDGTRSAKTVNWTINKANYTLSLNKTTLTVTVSSMTQTATVTRSGSGSISASSSDTSVATVSISGTTLTITTKKKGACTITVNVAADTNYNAPASKTITVNCAALPSSTLSECSWSEIRAATNAGVADKFWQVGALTDFSQLKGDIGGSYFDILVKYRIVDMTPTTITFLLAQNSAGVEIALTNSTYLQYIAPNTNGMCMNRSWQVGYGTATGTTADYPGATNAGGYWPSYGAQGLLIQAYSAMPYELRSVIRSYSVAGDNVGGGNTTSNPTTQNWQLFIPSQVEIYGTTTYINPKMANYTTQFAWFKAGNSKLARKSSATGQYAAWLLRDPTTELGGTGCFSLVGEDGVRGCSWANMARGFRFGFRV